MKHRTTIFVTRITYVPSYTSIAAASLFFCLAVSGASAQPASVADLRRGFEHPPADSRIMMRWWWFGPSVTKQGLEREIELMKEGGIGGFEVQPVYPIALDDAETGIHTPAFLSDEFLDVLRYASESARKNGMRIDVTLGSGWPYGGPHIPIAQAAGRLRVQRVKHDGGSRRIPVPSVGTGEALIAAYAGAAELTDIRDGAVWLPADLKAPTEIQFFISSRTGQMVKRPALGAEGYVLNHYDRVAIDNHLKTVGDRMLGAFGPQPPYAIFCDSLEAFGSDWTPDLLREFRARRGYDLKPHLPALAGAGPNTAAVRHDWGKTLTELVNERFFSPMRDWTRRNKTLFRIQGYGMPPATLSSNAFADLPEGEGSHWKLLTASRWASSASHLYGRPVTSSETWTWLHSPSFAATPLDLKAEANLHFLQGINQLIGHGWPYSAPGAEYPGWRFYASGVFNDKNPWWIVMPDLAAYLQRISFVLRQGDPVNDVAVYLPTADAWSRFRPGSVNLNETLRSYIGPDLIGRIGEAGFGLDFFDDGALEQLGRVEKGALAMGRNRYRMIILPGVETIPATTYEALERFATGGGILVATRRLPKLAPGFLAAAADHAKITETSRRLFEGASPSAHFFEAETTELAAKLAALLPPDASVSASAPDIGFVHRRAGAADIYFVANTANVRRNVEATFRAKGAPALWDPMSGQANAAAVVRRGQDTVTLALDLEAYGSRIVVFSAANPPSVSNGHTVSPGRERPAFELNLSENWTVRFGNGAPVDMPSLRSWTDDEATRFYSGTATYEKTLTVPTETAGQPLRLDFGEATPMQETPSRSGMRAWLDAPIRDAAVVYVNDRRAGSVWCPPYSLDITGLVKPGANRLRIVVGNVALNHMAGRALPDYRLLNLRYGVRFEPQDMDKVKPMPSGLLGPIRLIAGGR